MPLDCSDTRVAVRAPQDMSTQLPTLAPSAWLQAFESRFRDSVRSRSWPRSLSCRARKTCLQSKPAVGSTHGRLSRSRESRRHAPGFPYTAYLRCATRTRRFGCGQTQHVCANRQSPEAPPCRKHRTPARLYRVFRLSVLPIRSRHREL